MTPRILEGYGQRLKAKHGHDFTLEEIRQSILDVIASISQIMANTQSFGYHTPEDIYQESFYRALVVLNTDRYDPSKPLENFLYSHLKNRCINMKRDQMFRYEAPCKCCDAFNPGPNPCQRWHNWHRSNTSKQQLMRPLSLTSDACLTARPESIEDAASFAELDDYIVERLDDRLHEDYRQFKAEQPLTKSRRSRLRTALKAIISTSPWGFTTVV